VAELCAVDPAHSPQASCVFAPGWVGHDRDWDGPGCPGKLDGLAAHTPEPPQTSTTSLAFTVLPAQPCSMR
jgi:hypothetical protein